MRLFFCGGFNKSGTTFLQQVLTAHPAIHTPPEQQLEVVRRGLVRTAAELERRVRTIDRRTARQGVTFDAEAAVLGGYRGFVEALFAMGAPAGTAHFGLNDNHMWDDYGFHLAAFPEAGHIVIVRDPREVVGSLFAHKSRSESRFPPPELDKPDWMFRAARHWRQSVEACEAAAASEAGAGRFHFTRYEDLAGEDGAETLRGVLGFLGAEDSRDTAEAMLAANRFESAREREPGHGFYRRGPQGGWADSFSEVELSCAEAGAGAAMARWGYAARGTVTVKVGGGGATRG